MNRNLLALKIVANHLRKYSKTPQVKNMNLGQVALFHNISKRQLKKKQKTYILNRYKPIAYKNPDWKYSMVYNKNTVYFRNTPNGPTYFINKHGKRDPKEVKLNLHTNFFAKRPANGTWTNFLKRAYITKKRTQRVKSGQSKYQNKLNRINTMFKNANRTGNLSQVRTLSLPDLAFYYTKAQRFSHRQPTIVKQQGRWINPMAFYPVPMTKNDMINNIRNFSFNNDN
jgi:hypothetical protein